MSDNEEKLSLDEIKKLPVPFLMILINIAKRGLKKDPTIIQMFNDYNLDVNFLDLFPVKFGDIDTSARTDHGIITLNYKLLCSGNVKDIYSYLVHENKHMLDQCFGDRPTMGADDGNYLDNPYEREAFKHQIEYIANHDGEDKAEEYVEELLDHHNVKSKNKKDELEAILMEKVK